MPKHPRDIWGTLTPDHQQEILDHVDGMVMVARHANPPLHDIARWAIDGLGRSTPIEDAYAQGVEDGRQLAHDEAAVDA